MSRAHELWDLNGLIGEVVVVQKAQPSCFDHAVNHGGVLEEQLGPERGRFNFSYRHGWIPRLSFSAEQTRLVQTERLLVAAW